MPENRPLEGETAIVTGASGGIGEATVGTLAEAGGNVVLASRSKERLQAIADVAADDYDVETLVVETDVTEEDDVADLVDETVSTFGSIDVLVNNAGLVRGGDVAELPTEQYRHMMSVNTDGMFFTTREALPHLRDSDGTLIFIGSFAGQYPRPANPVYAATKWWTRGFAKSVSAAEGDTGLAVTIVNPTEVRTQFAGEDGDPFEKRYEEGEILEPGDVADAVVFAAKQDNGMISELDVYRRDKLVGF